jgi:hypothetical protein
MIKESQDMEPDADRKAVRENVENRLKGIGDCLTATHSAKRQCCGEEKGRVLSVPGPMGATQSVGSFDEVRQKDNTPFPQDAEEFWLCPCKGAGDNK